MSVPSNTQELQSVYERLCAQPRADGQGQVIAVSSHRTGAGTSFVARNLAMIAAHNTAADQQVLLLDADLQNNAQSFAFFSHEVMNVYGQPQGPYDATFGEIPFWMISPQIIESETDAGFVSLHTTMNAKLALTHFHWEQVRPAQNVMIRPARSYWHALRARYSCTFIDVPAFDRSDLKAEVCAEADTTVFVAARGETSSEPVKTLYQSLQSSGAHCAGLVINDVPVTPAYTGGAL